MNRRVQWSLVVVLAAGCASNGAVTRAQAPAALQFIEDDYAAALTQARERGVPLFIDAWAPWCHSCVFMREHVLNQPELAVHAKRFVFLAIDTEKPSGATFLEKFPIDNWPTLLVVDPKTETAAVKWLGTVTVPQFIKLLDDGEVALAAHAGAAPVALLAKADRLYAEQKAAEAVVAYREALASMPPEHPRRPRCVESLLNALYSSHQYADCSKTAAAEAPSLPKGPSFVNSVVWGLTCATSGGGFIEPLEKLGREALAVPGVLVDDTSGIYELLVEVRGAANDEAGKRALGREWGAFLKKAADQAATPAARAVFDPHRLLAALAAGEPLTMEAPLKQSEAELPDDYNPPVRLAVVYREAGRLDDALIAVDRALTKVYGPRKLRVLDTKASILQKKGDVTGRRRVLAEALEYGRALPSPQQPRERLKALEAELARP